MFTIIEKGRRTLRGSNEPKIVLSGKNRGAIMLRAAEILKIKAKDYLLFAHDKGTLWVAKAKKNSSNAYMVNGTNTLTFSSYPLLEVLKEGVFEISGEKKKADGLMWHGFKSEKASSVSSSKKPNSGRSAARSK